MGPFIMTQPAALGTGMVKRLVSSCSMEIYGWRNARLSVLSITKMIRARRMVGVVVIWDCKAIKPGQRCSPVSSHRTSYTVRDLCAGCFLRGESSTGMQRLLGETF